MIIRLLTCSATCIFYIYSFVSDISHSISLLIIGNKEGCKLLL